MPGFPKYLMPVLLTAAVAWPIDSTHSQELETADPKPRNAVSVFAGKLTDNVWEESINPWEVEFRDSEIVGVALSRRFWKSGDLSLEIEAQAARYFGAQEHWEFNLPLIARWERFPWDDTVDTSFAWGFGASYATEVPAEEVARNGTSERLLIYWVAEIEFGPPQSAWSGVFRLHHRSDGFGLIEDGSGSNVLALGIRRRF
ncbi:MAG: hypothetical protein HKM95_05325 [Inquilinus sp.]|nr:hypothetical protein [Inquilinus sp.]